MLRFMKENLGKIYQQFSTKIGTLCSQNVSTTTFLTELEHILIKADTGVTTAQYIIKQLQNRAPNQKNNDLKEQLGAVLVELLT